MHPYYGRVPSQGAPHSEGFYGSVPHHEGSWAPGNNYPSHYHHHYHHHHPVDFSAPHPYSGRGGFQDLTQQQQYNQVHRETAAPRRGGYEGRGNFGSRGDARNYGSRGGMGVGRGAHSTNTSQAVFVRENSYLVHIDSFGTLYRIRDNLHQLWAFISVTAQQAIQRKNRQGAEFNIVFLVGKKYVGGVLLVSQTANFMQHTAFLREEDAAMFTEVSDVPTDVGERLVDLPDGSPVSKHFFGTIKAGVLEVHRLHLSKSDTKPFHPLEMPLADVISQLSESLSNVKTLLATIDEAACATAPEGHLSFVEKLIRCNPVVFSTAVGSSILRRIFQHNNTRKLYLELLASAVDSVANAATSGAASEDNAVASGGSESTAAVLFRNVFANIFVMNGVTLAFGGFGANHNAPYPEEASIYITCLRKFGVEAISGMMGSPVVMMILRHLFPSLSASPTTPVGSKRSRVEEHDEQDNRKGKYISEIDGKRYQLLTALFGNVMTVPHLTSAAQHNLGCRLVQALIPIAAETLQCTDDAFSTLSKDERDSIRESSRAFVEIVVSQSAQLAVDNYGNYVSSTIVTEVGKVAESPVSRAIGQALLDQLYINMSASLVELAMSKSASNVLERFVQTTGSIAQGRVYVIKIAALLLELHRSNESHSPMVALCVHSFGNYVVKAILQSLSKIAAENNEEARRYEAELAEVLRQRMQQLRTAAAYSAAILNWVQEHVHHQ